MEELEKKIKQTDFTQDEWQTFKKVELNNQLNDLQMVLIEMLESEELTQEQLTTIMENIDLIIEKFDD